jgi:hypothetical protein
MSQQNTNLKTHIIMKTYHDLNYILSKQLSRIEKEIERYRDDEGKHYGDGLDEVCDIRDLVITELDSLGEKIENLAFCMGMSNESFDHLLDKYAIEILDGIQTYNEVGEYLSEFDYSDINKSFLDKFSKLYETE